MHSRILLSSLWSLAVLQAGGQQYSLEDEHPYACPDYKRYSAYPQYAQSILEEISLADEHIVVHSQKGHWASHTNDLINSVAHLPQRW